MSAEMEAQRRERERQREHEEEQRRLQQAFKAGPEDDPSTIQQLISDEDLIDGEPGDLQDATLAKIKSMMGRDPVLANLTEAQEHDIRYRLEVMKYKVISAHPPDESAITGRMRAFLLDDSKEQLRPLSQQERMLIDDFFAALQTRVTRGRGGFERKQINTSIAQTETKNDESGDSGGLFTGLFS